MHLTLADLSESDLLPRIWQHMPTDGAGVLVGPGDDAAVLDHPASAVVTTDTMVRGSDWLDEWSSGWQVGAKAVTQNVADVTAMGGRCTALLVTLVADGGTPVSWVEDLARGLGERAAAAGAVVVGGDLSSAPEGTRMVSIAALGHVDGQPVVRSGARVGDVLAVSAALGASAVGLGLLQRHGREAAQVGGAEGEGARVVAHCVEHHLAPTVDPRAGEVARAAGVTAMLDVSDGLARDGQRLAEASAVSLELEAEAVQRMAQRWAPVVGTEEAVEAVLTGGEEHCLLGTFPALVDVPAGWTVLGRAVEAGEDGPRVLLDGEVVRGGWDHFRA